MTVDTGGFEPGRDVGRLEGLGAAPRRRHPHDGRCAARAVRRIPAPPDRRATCCAASVYPLSVSAERVCQARRTVRWPTGSRRSTALAHGSTGAGNDQVRFDVAFRALAPDLEILAPIRELAPSRAEERAFLAERGFPMAEKTEAYSVNEGMWGTSVGGRETHDSWSHLPEEAFPGGVVDARWPRGRSCSPSPAASPRRSTARRWIPVGVVAGAERRRPPHTASGAACTWATPSSASRGASASRLRRRTC